MPRGKPVSDEIKTLIMRYREEDGLSLKQIANYLKMDHGHVGRILNRLYNPIEQKTMGRPRLTSNK